MTNIGPRRALANTVMLPCGSAESTKLLIILYGRLTLKRLVLAWLSYVTLKKFFAMSDSEILAQEIELK